MRVLISGAAGFIGSHVAELLQKYDNQVLIIDNFCTGKMDNILNLLSLAPHDVKMLEGDITDADFVQRAFCTFKPDAVIHLAAQAAISTSINNPVQDLRVNGIGTLNMLCAAVKSNVDRFVFSSTSAVYRENVGFMFKTKEDDRLGPGNPYGISKLAAEFYVRTLFANHVILRFGNVYGPRQVPIGENQVIARMIRHFKYGDKFYIFGNGEQNRDFVFVKDVAEACHYALYGTKGTYNIASGRSTSVNAIARIVEECFGVPGYKWEHTDKSDPRKHVCMNVGAASGGLGWNPTTDIGSGIRQTIEWWEKTG